MLINICFMKGIIISCYCPKYDLTKPNFRLCTVQLICDKIRLNKRQRQKRTREENDDNQRPPIPFRKPEWFATFCHFRWCKTDTRIGRLGSGEERSSTLIKIKRFGGSKWDSIEGPRNYPPFGAIVVCIFILKSHNEVSAKTTTPSPPSIKD